MKNACLFYIITLHLKFWRYNYVATSSFISCCFTSAFTSADIIFYNFLELHLTSEKKYFCHEFFFFNEFTQIPSPPPPTHPINGQNPLSMAKVFSWHSLKRLQANNKLTNAWMNRPPPLATACDRRRSILRTSSSKTNSETSKNIKVTSESSQLTLVLVDTSDGQLEMIH